MLKTKPTVISLFSGCGGLDLGFIWAGFEVVWANDNMPDAVETYRKNIGAHIELGDIKKIDISRIPDADVVIGGPPCQSFSLVGKRDPKDPRGNLIWNFLEVVETKKPKMFVLENVLGLKSAKDESGSAVLPELIKQFQKAGYTTTYFVLNAADYGVPQKRRRFFMVGDRGGRLVPPPDVTHSKEVYQPLLGKRMKKWVSVFDALSDLSSPKVGSDEGHYIKAPSCPYQKFMRQGNGPVVRNHEMPYMSEKDLEIIKAVPVGGNYMDVPDEIATKRILNFKRTGGRTTTYGRMKPREPSYTLNTHFSRPNVGCNIHYSEDRLITIREGLRLQSFPDRFVIYHKSKRSAYTQVGNAVPPLLARAIAERLIDYLK